MIRTEPIDFMEINVKAAYNTIYGRTNLASLRAVALAYHMKMNFPTIAGVGVVRCCKEIVRACYTAILEGSVFPHDAVELPSERSQINFEPVDDLEEVSFSERDDSKKFQVSKVLPPELKEKVIDSIQRNQDLFA